MPANEDEDQLAAAAYEHRKLLARISLKHYKKELARLTAILGGDRTKLRYRSALKKEILLALIANPEASDVQVCASIDDHWNGEPFFPPALSLRAVYRQGGNPKHVLEVQISKVRSDIFLSRNL